MPARIVTGYSRDQLTAAIPAQKRRGVGDGRIGVWIPAGPLADAIRSACAKGGLTRQTVVCRALAEFLGSGGAPSARKPKPAPQAEPQAKPE